ncbi:uncharacterized protein LOC109834592 [Asparagus officinalis]|uniref:uncharacterized protein LOC109834592 n=1 Tax=Asparagus officinalis TaxID=4686 RepID=UPI00098E21C6|nr:uncharacterized protein LOC109834592 [Asparagus officinalis]
MIERNYVCAFDNIEAEIDEHMPEIQDPVALGVFNRIKQIIVQTFHKTHVDEFVGREDMSRSFEQMYTRRYRPHDDDNGADTSHADGASTSQPHTQPDIRIIETRQQERRGAGKSEGKGKERERKERGKFGLYVILFC